jgi:hypothetical protein
MKLFSSFRKSPIKEHAAKAIIELVYAGNDMAAHLVMKDGRDYSCVCGMIVGPVENPAHHHNFCPVARFYAAVEAVRLPAQVPAPTSRYSTPALFAVLGTITAALIWAIVHFAQKAGLPW